MRASLGAETAHLADDRNRPPGQHFADDRVGDAGMTGAPAVVEGAASLEIWRWLSGKIGDVASAFSLGRDRPERRA
jgi:hypothetical protein